MIRQGKFARNERLQHGLKPSIRYEVDGDLAAWYSGDLDDIFTHNIEVQMRRLLARYLAGEGAERWMGNETSEPPAERRRTECSKLVVSKQRGGVEC